MSEGERCSVCGDLESDPELLSDCYSCGERFHLNPYSNREEKDCGDAWIGPSLGVEFHCQRCIEQGGSTSPDAGPVSQVEAMMREPAGGSPRPPTPPPGTPPARRQRGTPRRRYRRLDVD
jgi:hypothetical protein